MEHDLLETRIARLDFLDRVDDLLGGPAEPRLLLDALAQRRHARGGARRAPWPPLRVGVAHEAERREPLVALVVRGLEAGDRLLLRVGQIEAHPPAEVLAERQPSAGARGGVAVGVKDLVHEPLAVERDHALDAAGGDVVERLAAGDGLPDLHRPVDRARHARELAQVVAAVRHRRRQVVVLAVVAPRLLVEALEEHLHLLLEQLLVGGVVEHGRAERLDLACVVAAADAHDHAAAGEDIGHRVVLGQPDRMPHGQDVEGAPELEALGLRGKPRRVEDQVRDDLVALVLEVVLGRPQTVVAQLVHGPRHVPRREVGLGDALVRVAPRVGRRAAGADVVEIDLSHVERGELADHLALQPPSTTSACPLMYAAWSETRKHTADAMSSTTPRRPAGTTARTCSSLTAIPRPLMSGVPGPRIAWECWRRPVRIGPGHTALMVIPRAEYTTAICRVSPTTPCLAATYAAPPPVPLRPATEAMLTMRPRPRGSISRSARLQPRKTPVRSMSMTRRHSASSVSSTLK